MKADTNSYVSFRELPLLPTQNIYIQENRDKEKKKATNCKRKQTLSLKTRSKLLPVLWIQYPFSDVPPFQLVIMAVCPAKGEELLGPKTAS